MTLPLSFGFGSCHKVRMDQWSPKKSWMSDRCNNSVGKWWFMEFSQERAQKAQNIVDIQCNARWYEGLETWKSDTLPTSSAAVLRHLVTALRLISYWKHCWSLSEQLHAVISSFACSSYINMHLFLLKFLTLLTRVCLSRLAMAMVKLNPKFVYTIWLYDYSDFHKNIWIDEIFHDSHDSLCRVIEILPVRSKLSSAVVRIRNRISQRGP